MSLEQIGGTHYCPVCGEEDYPAIHVCVKALQTELTRLRAENGKLNTKFNEAVRLLEFVPFNNLKAENEELRLAIASVAQLVGVHSGPDKTMLGSIEGKFTELLIHLGKRDRENEELRKALEPFAIDSDPTEHSDDDTIGAEFTWGQCRRAAELLNRKTP